MLSATAITQRTPLLGRMFGVEEGTGLEEITVWPALMIMTSFVWLAIAGLFGLLMPITQFFHLPVKWFDLSLTAHGAALTFPFLIQFMVGVSLHRAGGCRGKAVTGVLPASIYWLMNVGSLLFTVAILLGFDISYAIMWPLPLVGVKLGEWSQSLLVLGFTGIFLLGTSLIILYPIQLLVLTFFGRERKDLLLEPRSIMDPGMLGMTLAGFLLLIAGIPFVTVLIGVMLGLWGILPMGAIAWATDAPVFQYAFWIFAHNLMEVMAIMITSAAYALLPLYLADGTRKLYSDRLANFALYFLVIAASTAFFHHFYTTTPATPNALAYHGNVVSWLTGVGAAFSIFTITATIWEHGLKPEPGIMAVLMGFMLYILDGVSALITSNLSWTYVLHGTMWEAGHTMSVLIAITLMWVGVLYHYYPVITGRRLSRTLGNQFVTLYVIGAIGLAYTFLVAGADGMPRRYGYWWNPAAHWMRYGVLLFVFGLILAASWVVLARNFWTSRAITTTSGGNEAVMGQLGDGADVLADSSAS